MAESRIKQFEIQLKHENAQSRAEEIIREAPPALAEKISPSSGSTSTTNTGAPCRYQVACAIKDIYDDVNDNRGRVYGSEAVAAMKDAFGWDDAFIYQALNVADTFTIEQIEDIAGMCLPGGRPVTMSHVLAIAGVEDLERREKLLDQTVRNGWTSKKLAKAVQPPAKKEGQRGRPLAKPRDFDAVLDQQDDFVEDFLSRNDKVWAHPLHSITGKAEYLEPPDFTRERADRLKRHADAMTLLARKAQERADEATQMHERFLEVMHRQTANLMRIGYQSLPQDEEAAA